MKEHNKKEPRIVYWSKQDCSMVDQSKERWIAARKIVATKIVAREIIE